MRFAASQVATATGGALHGPDVEVNGASIDSRSIVGGELFVPVRGGRDGHDFIEAALAAGASAYLTQRPDRPPARAAAVEVADTAAALAALGRAARDRLPDRVVGVTGSVGKTSTKDLLSAVLSRRWPTAASPHSFNNELGVPLTLINAPEGCQAAVVEMGARGIDHIAYLCGLARPTVGVVTAVAAVHTEMFGSLEQVARAKGELVEALPRSGAAVLNAADPRVSAMAKRTAAQVLRFGPPDGDVRASAVAVDDELRLAFRLHTPWGDADVRMQVRGEHHVANALAAAAAGLACGLGLDEVAVGLEGANLSRWRMELARTASGAVVINDAYNANPASMSAALRALAAIDAKRRVAVLGVMAELGAQAEREHAAVASLAEELGISVIAVDAGPYEGDHVKHVPDLAGAVWALGDLREGDAVLVKGSRVSGLERLALALVSEGSPSTSFAFLEGIGQLRGGEW